MIIKTEIIERFNNILKCLRCTTDATGGLAAATSYVNKPSLEPSPNELVLNKAYTMDQKKRRRFYTIRFKLQVVDYAKQHGNRAAERRFGPPPTERLARVWQG